jgi:hypothetical protein
MKIYFDHEELDVYQEAISFCGWVGKFLSSISAKAAAKDQPDRASTSIPLNIAEGKSGSDRGNARWTAPKVLVPQRSSSGGRTTLWSVDRARARARSGARDLMMT